MSNTKSIPKDGQVMTAILKDMGIIEYEPRVINQMLEFTYRYVTNVLEDARLFSSHAKKRGLDGDDVRLAIQLQMDKSFTTPPPRELLLEIARQKNSIALPFIKANAGPRLPPDRYSLTACNYHLKPAKKPRLQGVPTRLNLTSIPKVMPAVSLGSKTGATFSVVTKTVTSPTVTIVSRQAVTPGIAKPVPTPILKIAEANNNVPAPSSSSSSS
ncbi:transcription initiation factor TFIID subunit 9-like [Centruroides sculpturatus]|uniref:transcription initiation factor TFIID subunit 9-like n=1 Tax=Centruroides sculpturatus TaxID=218467 RepID=UPI000C6D345F|nr:transcription initiation factor TFIID subunit 9-like [Centruroides sculpturatus]